MTINTSHANITGGITNDILNILDITDSLYTNDTLDTIDMYRDWETDRKSTRLNSSHSAKSRMPSSA